MVKFDQEKILSLVNDRVKEKILLPEIQRKFVWKPKKILELIDSLWKDYPIGSFLIWKTEEEIETKNFEDGKLNLGRKYNEKYYLLDGQQRLTSLVLAIGKPIILFDLLEEKFVLFEQIFREIPVQEAARRILDIARKDSFEEFQELRKLSRGQKINRKSVVYVLF